MFHQVYICDTGQKDAAAATSQEQDLDESMKQEPAEYTAMETETDPVADEVDPSENDESGSKMATVEQGIIENLVAAADNKVKREKLTLKELKKPLKLKKAKILQYRKNRMSTFERYLLLKRNLKTPMVGKEQYVFVFVLNDGIHKVNSSPQSSLCNITDVSSAMTSVSPPERVKLDKMNLPIENIQNIASRVIEDLSKRNKSPGRDMSSGSDTGHKYFVVSNTTIPDENKEDCLPRRTRASMFRSAKAKRNDTSLIEYDHFLIGNGFIEDIPTSNVRAKKTRKVKKSKVQPSEKNFKCEVCVRNFKSETLLRRHKASASCKKRTSIFLGTAEVPLPKEATVSKEEDRVVMKEDKADVAYNSGFSDYEDNDVASDLDYEEPIKKLRRVRKKTMKYYCKKCLEAFDNKTLLNKHMRTVCRSRVEPPSKDTFVCEVCGKHFANRQVFKRHVRDHKEIEQNLRQYKCLECAKCFNRRASLYMHVKKVHRKKVLSYVCAHCGLKSISKEHIIAHEQIHKLPEGAELPTPFECYCGKSFISNHLLMEHRRQKHRPKRCTPCSQDFRSIPDLIKHKQVVHGKQVNQKCPVCLRELANVLSLNVHLENTHNIKNPGKEKSIQCFVCGKKFVTFGSFVNHMWECHEHEVSSVEIQTVNKKLTDDLSYFYNAKKMCPICHKELASALSLNNHIESIHKLRTCSATKSIRCNLCGKSFAMLGTYINHKTEIHKEEVQAAEIETINEKLVSESPSAPPSRSEVTCPSCGKLFKNRTSLYMHEYNVHRPSKNVVCAVCRMTFDGRKSYLDHKYDVHTPVEQKVCRLCNKQFRSRGAHWAHKYVHVTPSHRCMACGSVFKRKGDFTRHLKDKHNVMIRNLDFNKSNDVTIDELAEFITLNCRKTNKLLSIQDEQSVYKMYEHEIKDEYVFLGKRTHRNQSVIPAADNLSGGDNGSSSEDVVSKQTCETNRDGGNEHGVQFPTLNDCNNSEGSQSVVESVLQNKVKTAAMENGNIILIVEDLDKVSSRGNYSDSQSVTGDAEDRIENSVEMLKNPMSDREGIDEYGNNEYSCGVCIKTFKSNKLLAAHNKRACCKRNTALIGVETTTTQTVDFVKGSRTLDKERPWICEVCGKYFESMRNFKAHTEAHQDLKKYKCGECGKGFNWPTVRNKHVRIVHSKERRHEFVCTRCGLRTLSKEHLLAHESSHSVSDGVDVGKPFQCFCGKSYISKYLLLSHNKIKHKPKKCLVCSVEFPSLYKLMRHKKQFHTTDSYYKCPVCSKQLKAASLDPHLESRHGVRNGQKSKIICSLCDKTYLSFGTIIVHSNDVHGEQVSASRLEAIEETLTVNFGTANISCTICDKRLTSVISFNKHLENVHNVKVDVDCKCGPCDVSFDTLGSYIYHQKEMHDGEGSVTGTQAYALLRTSGNQNCPSVDKTCPICSKNLSTVLTLNNHLENIHNIKASVSQKCEACAMSFTTLGSYIHHKKELHNEPVSASVLEAGNGRSPPNTEGVRSFLSNSKPSCPVCLLDLSTVLNLDRHLERLHDINTCCEGKLIRCDQCDESFASLGCYVLHKKAIHVLELSGAELEAIGQTWGLTTRPRPAITCTVCGKNLKNNSSLLTHMRNFHTPSANEDLTCQVCHRSFRNRKAHYDHTQSAHNPGRLRTCDVCGKQFKDHRSLSAHKFVHLPRSYSCVECGVLFKRKGDHKKHLADKHCCDTQMAVDVGSDTQVDPGAVVVSSIDQLQDCS